MSSVVQNLLQRQNDPHYLNWLAVGDAFRFLCDGLRKYAENEMKEFHALITTNVGARGGSGIKCSCKCILGRKRNPHGQKTTCVWAEELKNFHVFSRKNDIPWHQSNGNQWHDPVFGYWEIAKVFMSDLGKDWSKTKDPSTTDIGPLLSLLIFCKHFKIQHALLENVRDCRNKWAHSPDHKLSDIDKQAAFKDIEKLISDPELGNSRDVQDCLPVIKRAETADFAILQDNELQIIQEFRRIQEFQEHTVKETNVDKSATVPGKMRLVPLTVVFLAVLLLAVFPVLYKVPGMFMFSPVSERNVMSDEGCPTMKSPINHFHFQEFDFSSHLAYKREGFVGRTWFFLELESILNESQVTSGVLITGEPGSGKSALMSQLICSPSSSRQIHNNIIGYHLCDYSEKGKRDGARFARNLVDQIAARFPEYSKLVMEDKKIQTELDKHCHKDPTACFFTTIVGPLKKLKQPKGKGLRFIIIDALDECFESGTSQIMDILNNKILYFPKWLKVILTSRNLTQVTSRLPRVVKRMSLLATDERNVEDIHSYISRFLSQNLKFSQTDSVKKFLGEVITRSEGNFLFVKTTLQYMKNMNGKINVHSLPSTLFDLYNIFFDRQFGEDGFGTFRPIFEVLLASFSPIQAQDLPKILKGGYEAADFRKLIKKVSCFLRFGRDGTVSIYHQSFAEWLVNPETQELDINKTRGHQSIAKFLLQRMIRVSERHVDVDFWEVTEFIMQTLFGGSLEMQETAMDRLNITEMRESQTNQSIMHHVVKLSSISAINLSLLTMFFRKFQTVDILDAEGNTPLHVAVEFVHEDVVKYLVQQLGADVHIKNSEGDTPLFSALNNFNFFGKRYFYNRCFTTNDGLFETCSTTSNDEIVRFLILSQQSNISKCDVQSAFLLNRVIKRQLPLSLYALLNVGVDINCQGEEEVSPLLQHIIVGGRQIGEFLKMFEVNISVKCGVPFMSSELHLMSYVTVSSDFGNFFTPSLNKKRFPIQRLIDRHPKGVRIFDECYDAEGFLPIHRAAQGGNLAAIKLFKSVGVNMQLKTRSGFTALEISILNLGKKNYGDIDSPRIYLLHHVHDPFYRFDGLRVPVTLSKYRNLLFEELLRGFFSTLPKPMLEFLCGPALEGLSLFHIAAVKGVNVLRYVHKVTSEIFPGLPINCVNRHGLDSVYLAHFYDSVQNEGLLKSEFSNIRHIYYSDDVLFKDLSGALFFYLPDELKKEINTDENIIDKEFGHESVPDAIIYPGREVEYILVSIYLYHPPLDKSTRNDLVFDDEIPISDCPDYYDNIPNLDTTVPLDDYSSDKSECSEIRVRHDYYWKLCMMEKKRIHVYTHNCPHARRDLQWRLAWNRRRNRQLSTFISTRMGWSVNTHVGDIYKLWPFYFVHKMYLEEYKAYEYLRILNEALEESDTRFSSKQIFVTHEDP